MICGKSLTPVLTTSVSPANSSCFPLFLSAFPELSDRKFPHPPTPLQSIRCRSGSIEKSSSTRVQRHPSTVLPSVSAATPLFRNHVQPPRDRVDHKRNTISKDTRSIAMRCRHSAANNDTQHATSTSKRSLCSFEVCYLCGNMCGVCMCLCGYVCIYLCIRVYRTCVWVRVSVSVYVMCTCVSADALCL